MRLQIRSVWPSLASGALVWAVLATGTATAQTPASDPPRITLGGAGGIANPWHGDRDYLATAWLGSVGVAVSPRATIEGHAGGWRHSVTTTRENVPLQGPDGVIGLVGRLTQTTTESVTGFGVSLLARAGRTVRFTAGGGPAFYTFRRRFDQSSEDCQASDPRLCNPVRQTFQSVRAGAQGLADVGFAASRLVHPFVQVRVEIPDLRDPASGHTSFLAGMRLAFR